MRVLRRGVSVVFRGLKMTIGWSSLDNYFGRGRKRERWEEEQEQTDDVDTP